MKWILISLFLGQACLVCAQGVVRTLEPCPCQVAVDSSFTTTCAYLIVPGNRKKDNGKTIKVPFIVVHSRNPDKKKDPFLFTGGGPGNSSLQWAVGATKRNIIKTRDCIAFEQRGTRFAVPYIRSYELDTAIKESYRNNLDKDSMVIMGIKKYRQTLEARGVDLTGYNSDESIADMDDLLATLKIDSVNLLGGSYSGGLMMGLLQKDPARVRSLVLDSPLPMFAPIDEDEHVHFMEALNILFERAEKDSANKVLYGNLKERFQSYFNSITEKVFFISYREKGTAEFKNIAYTKNDLLQVIEDHFGNLSALPKIVTDLVSGNHETYIRERLDDIFNKNTAPDGMRISVYCADQSAYHNPAIIEQMYQVYPFMRGYHINDVYNAICDCWNSPPIARETKQAFYSNKPALLADGQMDNACAPLYIDMIHHYLPNSQRILFTNRAHGVAGRDFEKMVEQFLENPGQKLGSLKTDMIVY